MRNDKKIKDKIKGFFGNKCMICEQVFPNSILEIHFLDNTLKNTYNLETFKKCIEGKILVMCANCNRMVSRGFLGQEYIEKAKNFIRKTVENKRKMIQERMREIGEEKPDASAYKLVFLTDGTYRVLWKQVYVVRIF